MSDRSDTAWTVALWAAIAFVVWFSGWGRNSAIRYQLQYSADSKDVTIDREPIDCEFMSAPLGNKDCHYEKVVTVVMFAPDKENGKPVISFDNGETWSWNEGGRTKGAVVHVSWAKQTP